TTALYREAALFIQRKNAFELDLKNSLRQALWAAHGSEREETARDAAAKIAFAEAFLERYADEQGVKADLWVGVASESEIAALLEKTRAARAWSAKGKNARKNAASAAKTSKSSRLT
ncbi:MAG: hypothetical protein QW343_02410, partial [Candidatus Norongarragalinales archaeon]